MAMKEEKGGVPPQEKIEIKGISIPSGKADEAGIVFYFVNVEGSFQNTWSVAKRYSQFEELHSALLLSDFSKKFLLVVTYPKRDGKYLRLMLLQLSLSNGASFWKPIYGDS